ncbi:MAG: hypothetical protein SFU98_18415 [Leptospiraceae bacterium]|nr:hypothetical protein [Leptospiraceae bacterium]
MNRALTEDTLIYGCIILILFCLFIQFIIISGIIANFKIFYSAEKISLVFQKVESTFYVRILIFTFILFSIHNSISFIKPYQFNRIHIGNDIQEIYKEYLVSENLLEKDEKILYWYSDNYIDFKKYYVFLSDKKLVVKNQNIDQIQDYKITLEAIHEVKIEDIENFNDFSMIRFKVFYEEEWLELHFYISNFFNIDKRFFTSLKEITNN